MAFVTTLNYKAFDFHPDVHPSASGMTRREKGSGKQTASPTSMSARMHTCVPAMLLVPCKVDVLFGAYSLYMQLLGPWHAEHLRRVNGKQKLLKVDCFSTRVLSDLYYRNPSTNILN